MNEKTDGFGDPATGRGCERAEDLLAHLYGEAGPGEAAVFGEHLNDCAVCREELAAFRQLRSGVADWHAAVLSAAPSLDLNRALRQEPLPFAQGSRVTERATRERSAMAALREFFLLSPLWLRVGTVTAAVAVCALAALTLLRTEITWAADGFAFRTGVPERVVEMVKTVETPSRGGYTREQVDAIAEERARQQVAEAERRWEQERQQEQPASANAPAPKKSAPQLQLANAAKQRRRAPSPHVARSDARLTDDDDESLPRLSDLLSDVY